MALVSPGAGRTRQDDSNARLNGLLHGFRDGTTDLERIFAHQRDDILRRGRRRFARFYLDGLGLSVDAIALLNVAWCATAPNTYPSAMLRRCFVTHTLPLLRILDPTLVLLSGSSTHSFARSITAALPQASVEPMLHYAHRGGARAEGAELERVSRLIRVL